jgi:DNA-binding NarL/FixJ family response regulator
MTPPRQIAEPLSSRRVLLVDDSELWCSYVRSVLQQSSKWELVGEASDGAEAVEKAAALQPDLILLDVGLPTLNGIEAARRIRRHDPEARILFVSEHRAWEFAEAALRTGARGYVVKSDAARELLPAMNAITEGRRFISPRLGGRPLDERAERVPCEARRHEAGFYSDETLLLDHYARLAEAALQAGSSLIIVDSRRDQVQARLEARGLDVVRANKEGRYLSLDVADCLSNFLIDGWPDEARFWDAATSLVMKAAKASTSAHPGVAACGECAPVLWREGRGDAAVRLEQLWDDVARTCQVDIFCGYSMSRGDQHAEIFQRICAEHSAVHSR